MTASNAHVLIVDDEVDGASTMAGAAAELRAQGAREIYACFVHPTFSVGAVQRLQQAGLTRIASLTGGRFFRARALDELAGIYAEIDRLEPTRRAGQAVRPRIERYPWPLGAGLALGLLALAWRRRRA